MRTAVKDRENNKTGAPGAPTGQAGGLEAVGGRVTLLSANSWSSRSACAFSSSRLCSSSPMRACSSCVWVWSTRGGWGGGVRGEGTGKGSRRKRERERGGVIYHEQDRAGQGEEVSRGKRGDVVRATRGPASRSSVGCTGFFKGTGWAAATLPKLAHGGGGNGHPGPFCHPQVALPVQLLGRSPGRLPYHTGSVRAGFHFRHRILHTGWTKE